jgi:hypothetical protein
MDSNQKLGVSYDAGLGIVYLCDSNMTREGRQRAKPFSGCTDGRACFSFYSGCVRRRVEGNGDTEADIQLIPAALAADVVVPLKLDG